MAVGNCLRAVLDGQALQAYIRGSMKKKELTLGQRFEAARARIGISQEKMARRLDVGVRTYTAWAHDERPAPLAYLELAERIAADSK